MIEVNQVSFSYGKTSILKDISLRFRPGKLYVIIGPNGSGKTTLVKLLSRLAKPKSGSLTLEGRPYEAFPRKAFARQVALLPQGRNTPNITVWELVACGRYPWLDNTRKLAAQDVKILEEALARTETAQFAQRNVKTLSGGQCQRVYMAMLEAQDTPYVILDEPTTHLDIGSGFAILEQLVKLKQSGKSVIAVVHDLSMALKYADEVILMDGGEVRFRGSPAQLVKEGLLEIVFHVSCIPVMLGEETEYIFVKK